MRTMSGACTQTAARRRDTMPSAIRCAAKIAQMCPSTMTPTWNAHAMPAG